MEESMRQLRKISALVLAATALPVLALSASSVTASASSVATCASLTKSLVTSEGFSGATAPVVTPYNYAQVSKNQTNALGTLYDFGPKALIVACVAPSDLKQLSVLAKSKTTMSATQYMAYVVKQSQGSMTKTTVGPVSDYLDFGNGKEDGVGSLSSAASLRLDAWVAGNYIFLTFSQPATQKPSAALMNFIKFTVASY
jgi:hypothetical protein